MSRRVVDIDQAAGFCFGVEKAIEEAELHLRIEKSVYSLGQMVHNEQEIARLEDAGLKAISIEDFPKIGAGKVILRAHGEPPETYQKAKQYGIDMVDATCPIVKKLQDKIRKVYSEIDSETEQIVIYGKEGHPETIGLMGQTLGSAVLITEPEEIGAIDPSKKIHLFSQTTMDPEKFKTLENNIGEIADVAGVGGLVSNCTICNQMKRRKPDLRKFAEEYDVVFFVSGRASSNGAMLYQYCKGINENTYWIHSVADIETDWLKGDGSVGVTGATSTPMWQLEKVKNYIESLIKE